MSKTKYTFWELMSDPEIQKGIEIPMIQRDYAQGRNKPAVNEIRVDFLNDILTKTESHLTGKTKTRLELDFVYGSIENKKFIPLDGQQRLTTLFLIHWYIALKDRKLANNRELFSKFSYQTRTTSRDFCDKLTDPNNEVIFWNILFGVHESDNETISKIIKNQSWFYLNWKHDPTIQSMLVMIDEIHKTFKNTIITFEDLEDKEKQLITFHYLPINTYGLSDSLYIKMNARGKVLTDFENFKAKFENFIHDKHRHLKEGFTEKIDGIWCDLIWDYIKNQNESKASNAFDLVDKPLLNLIYYISEMLFHKSNLNKDFDFDIRFKTIELIYASEENLKFLYKALDVFTLIGVKNQKENINEFFENIFSKNYKENKVAIFDENRNLFERCIFRNGFEIKEKLLLYSIIFYFTQRENKDVEISDNLKDYIRVCRNYILSINQKSKDEFVPELRREFYSELINTLDIAYDVNDVYSNLPLKRDQFKYKIENIKHEIDKASVINSDKTLKPSIHKLEDHKYLKGAIHNFEFNDKTKLEFIANEFHLIWSKLDDGLITRALLSVGDYSEFIGNSGFGGVWFFGKGEKWNRILTVGFSQSNKIKDVLKIFFDELLTISGSNSEVKLNVLIDTALLNFQMKDWKYYFIKYSNITSEGRNIFTFLDDETDFRIERLGGTSLRSYHLNVFISAVIDSERITNKVKKDFSQKDNVYCLIFMKQNMHMYPLLDYWIIDAKKSDFTELAKEFRLEQIPLKNEFKLFPTKDKDFVEIAIDFINKIYE